MTDNTDFTAAIAASREYHHALWLDRPPGDGLADIVHSCMGQPTGERVTPPPTREPMFDVTRYQTVHHRHGAGCLTAIDDRPGRYHCASLPKDIHVHDHGQAIYWIHGDWQACER